MTQLAPAARSWAALSDDGRYRYRLGRRWADEGPCDVWIMLNPSTADAMADDPTIRRCIGFSKRDGMAGIVVVNLYALRATNPRDLRSAADPVGPENDEHITAAVTGAWKDGGRIVCAWGAHPFAAARALDVAEGLRDMDPRCLGTTRTAAPRHPLYVKGDTEIAVWDPPC